MAIRLFILFLLSSLHVQAQKDTSTILDGSLSEHASTFRWRQVSGHPSVLHTPDSVKCKVSGLTRGEYEFELTCTNEFGEDKDSILVTIIKGVLSIPDSIYQRPRTEVRELDIKVIHRSTDIYVQVKSPRQQQLSCVVFNASGRALAKVSFPVSKGTSYISLPKPKVSGVYFLRFYTYFEAITQQIII